MHWTTPARSEHPHWLARASRKPAPAHRPPTSVDDSPAALWWSPSAFDLRGSGNGAGPPPHRMWSSLETCDTLVFKQLSFDSLPMAAWHRSPAEDGVHASNVNIKSGGLIGEWKSQRGDNSPSLSYIPLRLQRLKRTQLLDGAWKCVTVRVREEPHE